MQAVKPKVELFRMTPDPLETVYRVARRCYSGEDGIPEAAEPQAMVCTVKSVIQSGHTSVLEHVSFTFHVSGISRACSHQLVRHRLASYAQQSQRYAYAQHQYVVPPSISGRPNTLAFYQDYMNKVLENYDELVAMGIPKEDARYILPNAVATSIVVTMNARELYESFLPLRLCMRAQWEIREVAWQMFNHCRSTFGAIFNDAGARCAILGYCPEKKSCGKCPTLDTIKGENNG